MKNILLISTLLLTSCSGTPGLFQSQDDANAGDAIHLSMSKDAMKKNTDVSLSVDVKNNQTKQ